MRHFFQVLWAGLRAYVIGAFQYRVQEGMQLIGLLVESLIYLIVWTTVAREQGGEVGGFTVGEFAGYFIAWMFVRNITTGWSPFAMEWQIRRGDFNSLLLRPIHPVVTATSDMLASKTVAMITVVPTMIVLTLIFRPQFELIPWSLLALLPALVLAFVLRYTLMYVLALTAFWTTRVTALFELWFAAEFFFSGRIAPLSVLPGWAQQVSNYLPFRWMFYFPLELLLGRSTPDQAAFGFINQLIWLTVTFVLLRVVWRGAVRQYGAVGG